jgi:hypothetical protein
MRRLAPLLAIALVLAVSAGALGAGLEWCADDCAGDAPDGGCALEACCSCCVHSRVDPPGSVGIRPAAVAGESVLPALGLALASADPRDILHVPKPSLSSVV